MPLEVASFALSTMLRILFSTTGAALRLFAVNVIAPKEILLLPQVPENNAS
jgi:hypothetical protein